MTTPLESYCLIPLTQGQFAKVSPQRFEELGRWKWFAWWCDNTKSFYAGRMEPYSNKKGQHLVSMHRVILDLQHGDKRKGDHRNHDTLDNTDGNLRIATSQQNGMNGKRRSNNKSGYTGVILEKAHGSHPERYLAFIRVEGKTKKLARLPVTPEGLVAAARVYDAAAIRHFGEFAHLNFP